MKKLASYLMLMVLSTAFLTACAHQTPTAQQTDADANYLCTVPTNLPRNAMGELGIQIIRLGDNVRVIIPTSPVFETRSAVIRDSAYPGLNKLAQTLAAYRHYPMTIRGYTDDLGTQGQDQQLAEQQARSLQTFLWTRGFHHQCITPIGIGKGEAGQVASNRSPLGSLANRRVEITFKAQPSMLKQLDTFNVSRFF